MSLIKKLLMSLPILTASAIYAIEAPEPPPLMKPHPPPAHVSSSEGMAPLPYPAVFQKRQEKKNPPQPPILLTKISTRDAEDWTRTPNDLKGLLVGMSKDMNVNFSSNIKSLSQISIDPMKNPVLYRSGYKSFQLDDREAKNLREYLFNGGTIIFNALVGNPNFTKSALETARRVIPERPIYTLRLDHPIFHSYFDIQKVKFNPRAVKDKIANEVDYPKIQGVDIDNRTAIIISPFDFSCGWEDSNHPSWGYMPSDAKKLGANILSYVTAMRDAGRSLGKSVELVDANKKNAGKFRVGQVIHNGVWKTRSSSFPMLLNQFNSVTGTPVSFSLEDIALDNQDIFSHPFLYLTGTTDFSLSQNEITNLRRYLLNGGVLFAEASEGRPSFDNAFREEISKVVPGKPLALLPQRHSIYKEPFSIESVKARSALAAKNKNQIEMTPELYGLEINGSLAVIYCPYDLSTGWERALAPYSIGYEAKDSTALGINILFNSLSH